MASADTVNTRKRKRVDKVELEDIQEQIDQLKKRMLDLQKDDSGKMGL